MKSLGPEQILNSFWTNNFETLYELCSSGKSGSLFYFTKDRKYMMKTIPKREYLKMKEFLKGYYNYLKENPESLIIRFYGLHQVQWHDESNKLQVRYLTIMGNIFKDFEIGLRYDLKGSTAGRQLLKEDQTPKDNKNVKTAMKDNDFTKHIKRIEFEDLQQSSDRALDMSTLLTKKKTGLSDILKADADFLGQSSIIDYSLLVGEILDDPAELRQQILAADQDSITYRGVHFSTGGKPYVLGVIDPLTGYNFAK